ncbi:MAG: hypothetical protein M9928_15600 [Anaerolineae bacterium]|nr:hypothetical protein [Anaerolineae bacterium]MCO5194562.1 hypothetical protein [Anaerolineae bacterium]MCO5199635.1 hypothetical protein [Anaerolineae bacterium]MCO5206461.1 hypothetical protein [Anaerolineae bacterium]
MWKNEKEHDIIIDDELTGSITLPRVLTPEDFDLWWKVQHAPKPDDEWSTWALFDSRKHMVRECSIIGHSIENFRGKGRPWPRIAVQVVALTEPLLREAVSPPLSLMPSANIAPSSGNADSAENDPGATGAPES